MPRRTRKGSLLKSKPQLPFLEPPLDGATHRYGPQVRSALNPRSFLSEQRPSSSERSSWVTPQFDSSMQLQYPIRRRGGTRKSLGSSVLDRSLLLSLPQLRKTSVCKFPALSFKKDVAPQPHPQTSTCGERTDHPPTGALQERQASGPLYRGVSPNSQDIGDNVTPKRAPSLAKGVTEEARVCRVVPTIAAAHTARETQGQDCTIVTPVRHNPPDTDSGFTPPDVETPEMLPGSGGAAGGSHLSRLRLLFPLTPLSAQSPPDVLVSDTPEQDYGLRVSRRRRRRRFLQD
ncbi:hypothetical protein MATL_G00261280 [Megalops atlanticus]|uniref:Uncharacterized protein n=1 Tax=Megalops atlanticus TaxID=7932 RepID=A0A9D3PD70_MEGAT|nr:hypothetical protein MATL_G00261280 [Megalops atlanticus]